MASCIELLRWIVFALNLFFWLVGLGTLGIACWLRFDPAIADYLALEGGNLESLYIGVYFLMLAGLLMTLLGFLGCCGAWRESQCMLASFFILLVFVFVVELFCAVKAYLSQDQIKQYITDSLDDTVQVHYGQDARHTQIFDRLQTNLQCCGTRGYIDWTTSYFSTGVSNDEFHKGVVATQFGRAPQSCCNKMGQSAYPDHLKEKCGTFEQDQPLSVFERYLHSTGCRDALFAKFSTYTNLMIFIAVVVGILQLIGMVLSMLLCCWIGRRKEDDRKTGGYY